jgi:succinate dehydrogenase/fumarate reductase flavoprotein subunit
MSKTNVQHDVIVIGAGIAGLVAANRSAQLGKRVVVLEKSKEDKYLCNSRYTYGTFHINFTDVAADEDVLFGKIEACTEGLARKDLARAIAKDGRRLMHWLTSEGHRSRRSRRLPDQRSGPAMAQGVWPDLAGLCRRRRAGAPRRKFSAAPGPDFARDARARAEACFGRHRG